MKLGDPIWLVHEVGTAKTMFRGWIHSLTFSQIKIRQENLPTYKGISSLIFMRNEDDVFPFYERLPKKMKAKPTYRLEPRI